MRVATFDDYKSYLRSVETVAAHDLSNFFYRPLLLIQRCDFISSGFPFFIFSLALLLQSNNRSMHCKEVVVDALAGGLNIDRCSTV